MPVVVLEYWAAGHRIGGTARQRDKVKRQALERAS
jgi:hypothetical protein